MPTSLTFPVLTQGPSQDGFGYKVRDFTLIDDAEFPYTYSRPKATRDVGAWTVSYKDLSDPNFRLLWNFWRQVKMSGSFYWTDPTGEGSGDANAETPREVRFSSFSNPTYAGFGDSHLWDVDFELTEV